MHAVILVIFDLITYYYCYLYIYTEGNDQICF